MGKGEKARSRDDGRKRSSVGFCGEVEELCTVNDSKLLIDLARDYVSPRFLDRYDLCDFKIGSAFLT